jgi:hypothetical protein
MYPVLIPYLRIGTGKKFSVPSCQFPVVLLGAWNWELGTKPFEPLFLEQFCMMVRLGLARSHVQPCPRNNFRSSQLSVFSSQSNLFN